MSTTTTTTTEQRPLAAEELIRDLTGAPRTSMIDLLRARAELHGDAPFLVWQGEKAQETWSYAEAWTEVERVAAGWRQLGLEVGSRVASFAWNAPDVVWAWLGAQAAGATFVPINRNLRGALLRDQIERVNATHIVTEREGDELLRSAGVQSHAPARILLDGRDTGVRVADLRKAKAQPIPPLDPAAIGFVTFTSGSTGRSKAVRLTNHSLIRSACAYASEDVLDLGVGDVLFGWNPLFHLGGLIPLAIASGAACALYPGFSASRFWDQIHESHATYVEGFPVMVDYLLSQEVCASERTHSLRTFFVAGHEPATWSEAHKRFGIPLSNVAYDMSETGLVLYNPRGRDLPSGSCGIPYSGWRVALEGDDGRHVVGPGSGEMIIRPAMNDVIFDGYEGDAEATVVAWRDLWFHTGDWMSRDADGNYFLHGRMANRIRRRGENVSEEELVGLVRSHPEIRSVAVVALPSSRGEHDIKLAIEPASTPFDLEAFVSWCRTELPRFMMPRYFELWKELPVLPSEKVDLQKLRRPGISMVDIEVDPRFTQHATASASASPSEGVF